MTLYRQLLAFTLVLLGALLVGVWVEKLQSTRTFLEAQLAAHAQDTATSLGLSLTPFVAEEDLATVETMINAVFDRGYYQHIRLVSVEGELLLEKALTVEAAGVPDWFVALVPLAAPEAETMLMAGWNRFGTLQVESHPGYAYQTLWQTVVRISFYFLLATGVVMAIGGLGLAVLLRPLKRVEEQAEAICRREYDVQESLPKTRELRQVVESMNRMTIRVREMFDEQTRVAERLRRNAFSDQLTGLGNRRYLDGQVEARLEMEGATVKGALLLVLVHDLKELNEERGFAEGDALLKKVAEILRETSSTVKNVALARMTGGNSAVFLPEASPEDAAELAAEMCRRISRLALEQVSYGENVVHVGGVTYAHSPTLSQLLAEADTALSAAQSKGANCWQVVGLSVQEAAGAVKGRSWWRQTLEDVMARRAIELYRQPVVRMQGRQPFCMELLSRITLEGGELVSAGGFVQLAEALQLISRFDRSLLEEAVALKKEDLGVDSVAVNVSPASFGDAAFVDWLLAELARLGPGSLKFIFEFSEFAAVQYLDTVKPFAQQVEQLGHAIALDDFGQSFGNFGYLKSLRPQFVKLDRPLIQQLEKEEGDAHFYVGALCGVAHSLDIQVIAEGVEREEQAAAIGELHIDAFQGYLVGRPEPV